jgi:hypothetical protein
VIGATNAAFSAWDVWRRGSWPFANWLAVPLSLLTHINVIDLVYQTTAYMNTKDSDWTKLTETQREIVQWLEVTS